MLNCKTGCLAILILTASGLHAEQRKYILGTAIDLTAGLGGLPNASPLPLQASQQGTSFSYGAIPSLELRSMGEHSNLTAIYAFGLTRTNGDLTFNSTSHVVSTNFFASARKWKFNFSDFFTMTSDFNTFNATHGGFSIPEDSRITVFPTGSSQSSHINSAQMQADYILNERSGLSFGGSHLLQDYPDTSLFQHIFSDQQRISGNVAYVRRTSEHSTWSLGYSSSYLTFSQSESARVQGIIVGHSREIRPGLTLTLKVGPSFVAASQSGRSYVSYDASVTLQKAIKSNRFSLYYAQNSGDASGLASVSNTRRVGFAMDRLLGKNANLFLDLSAIDTQGQIDNSSRLRSVSAAANIGIRLNKVLSIHWGGQYQRYDQQSSVSPEQKRLFASLRVSAPELWRFSR